MLAYTSLEVAECLEKAAEAHQRALSATLAKDREFWREMESKWETLAERYVQTNRLMADWGV
jgi:hypothetical protein